eukprot:IDg1845t1
MKPTDAAWSCPGQQYNLDYERTSAIVKLVLEFITSKTVLKLIETTKVHSI